MNFLLPEVALCLYKSNIQPDMEHCFHVWTGAPSGYLDMLAGPNLALFGIQQSDAAPSKKFKNVFGTFLSARNAEMKPLQKGGKGSVCL